MSVTITIERGKRLTAAGEKPASVTSRVFDDVQAAAKFLVEDSYFCNPDVGRVVWERSDPAPEPDRGLARRKVLRAAGDLLHWDHRLPNAAENHKQAEASLDAALNEWAGV